MIHRLHQVWLALTVRTQPSVERALFPNVHVFRLFRSLAIHDQRHLLEVRRRAAVARLRDDVCQAGLLHDIGKVSLSGVQVTVVARIVRVLADALSGAQALPNSDLPVTTTRMSREHSSIGAERLRALGVSESVCRIVELHDCDTSTDSNLLKLHEIDSTTP